MFYSIAGVVPIPEIDELRQLHEELKNEQFKCEGDKAARSCCSYIQHLICSHNLDLSATRVLQSANAATKFADHAETACDELMDSEFNMNSLALALKKNFAIEEQVGEETNYHWNSETYGSLTKAFAQFFDFTPTFAVMPLRVKLSVDDPDILEKSLEPAVTKKTALKRKLNEKDPDTMLSINAEQSALLANTSGSVVVQDDVNLKLTEKVYIFVKKLFKGNSGKPLHLLRLTLITVQLNGTMLGETTTRVEKGRNRSIRRQSERHNRSHHPSKAALMKNLANDPERDVPFLRSGTRHEGDNEERTIWVRVFRTCGRAQGEDVKYEPATATVRTDLAP
ncbi:unnamed protein product [Cyprideis torosa]|uniref:Uncharacterized protein n=1 Tax=Cyprideis torosa TaxID=163714 RepID=A0A7R8WB73_9CRUS|nr:unnamed protein product [Cyprideis torosa]CAG0891809.1 unnamed protein product [Cyprideis torosa]